MQGRANGSRPIFIFIERLPQVPMVGKQEVDADVIEYEPSRSI